MVICVDRVRKKTDKFLDTIYKSNPKNEYLKSDTIDVSVKTPRVVRGITRIDLIKQFLDNNIDFYYIDTGYMGCYPDKDWHRFTKNNFQTLDHLNYKQLDFLTNVKKLKERFAKIMKVNYDDYKPKRPIAGDNILIIPLTKNATIVRQDVIKLLLLLFTRIYTSCSFCKCAGIYFFKFGRLFYWNPFSDKISYKTT